MDLILYSYYLLNNDGNNLYGKIHISIKNYSFEKILNFSVLHSDVFYMDIIFSNI